MKRWGYKNYLDSVRRDMRSGIDDMGFSPLQAFGFAHNELELRLGEFPEELPFALVALSICLLEYNGLAELSCDQGFVPELKENIYGLGVQRAMELLDKDSLELFKTDLEKVTTELKSAG